MSVPEMRRGVQYGVPHHLVAALGGAVGLRLLEAEPEQQGQDRDRRGLDHLEWGATAFVGQHAQVVVSLDQVVSNSYSAPGTHLSTLLSCQLDKRSQGWLVTDFRGLYPNSTAFP